MKKNISLVKRNIETNRKLIVTLVGMSKFEELNQRFKFSLNERHGGYY